jgi:hypothetical protein
MMLAEQQQEVREFRVCQTVPLGEQEVAQLTAGCQQQAQMPHVLLAVGKGRARWPHGWRHPSGEDLALTLSQFTQHVRQQDPRPVQRPPDPAYELATGDVGRVAAQCRHQRRERASFADESGDDGEDLAEARGLVRHVGTGAQAGEPAAWQAKFLNEERLVGLSGSTAAPAVSMKRPQEHDDVGVDQPDPVGMIPGGYPIAPQLGYDGRQDLLVSGCLSNHHYPGGLKF